MRDAGYPGRAVNTVPNSPWREQPVALPVVGLRGFDSRGPRWT